MGYRHGVRMMGSFIDILNRNESREDPEPLQYDVREREREREKRKRAAMKLATPKKRRKKGIAGNGGDILITIRISHR